MNEKRPLIPDDYTKPYREVMELVSQNTDDFMYLIDFAGNRVWFFGDIDRDYSLRDDGKEIHAIQDLLKIVHPADCPALIADFDRLGTGRQKAHNMDYRWVTRDGRIIWINCRGNVVLSTEEGLPVLMIGRVSEHALRHLYTPLTGLWNNMKFRQDMPARLEQDHGSVMLVDIDGLATINLLHGREFGDLLLRELADLLQEIPSAGQVYHVEHNNFAVVFDTDSTAVIEAEFVRIRELLKDKCTLSAGVVPASHAVFSDVGSLMDSARLTLNRAKTHAGPRLEFFSMAEVDRKFAELNLLDELSHSIHSDFAGFEVYYQPQVKAGSYELFGMEALLRFTSPTRGRIFPDEFIPLLEQSRLINEVGLWVLRTAMKQCREWREALPSSAHPLHMSVNFSIVQFEDPFLAEKILEILRDIGIPGDALTVELTESLMLHENHLVSNTTKYLKAAGVSFSIDDFGVGYSNFAYLKHLNVDEIKIDRSFVSNIEKETYHYKLIGSILDFAHAGGIRVCCEGMESVRELAVLEGLHPDILQGYLFDKPMSSGGIERTYFAPGDEAYERRMQFIDRLYEFKDHMGILHFDPKDILRKTNIGLWVIRIDPSEEYFEMHPDDTMEHLLGVDRKLTGEECFAYWRDRVAPAYVEYMYTRLAAMMETDKVVQMQYVWHHPTLGEVTVRCNGRRVENSDGMIVLEGYHRILDGGDRI